MSTEKKFSKQVQQAVSVYKKMLDTHCATGDSINQVAAEHHISRNTVQLGFRRKAGMGIRQYKLRLRMNRSRELLEAGKDIKEIATLLHYRKLQTFSRAFKRHHGVTPTEFNDLLAH